MIRGGVRLSLILATLVGVDAQPVVAHGTAERYDLPLPLGYYVAGSALVVALSFVVAAAFVYREPRAQLYSRVLFNVHMPLCRALAGALQALGVAALGAVIATGLCGNQHPARNMAPTLVWVAWWVGLCLFVALVANIWPALNPWCTLSRLIDRMRAPAVRPYPARLSQWPAVGTLLAFVWIELVSPYASSPRALAFLAVHQAVFGVYLGCTFAPNHKGMAVPTDDLDFLRRQVLTSRNVRGGRMLDIVLGGLNYQIEHHLFPHMPMPHLRQAQPLVRQFCADHGIAYCETGLLRSYGQALRHLHRAGAPLRRQRIAASP